MARWFWKLKAEYTQKQEMKKERRKRIKKYRRRQRRRRCHCVKFQETVNSNKGIESDKWKSDEWDWTAYQKEFRTNTLVVPQRKKKGKKEGTHRSGKHPLPTCYIYGDWRHNSGRWPKKTSNFYSPINRNPIGRPNTNRLKLVWGSASDRPVLRNRPVLLMGIYPLYLPIPAGSATIPIRYQHI